MSGDSTRAAFTDLQRRLVGCVSCDSGALSRVASDFGGWVRRVPAMVVTPGHEDDLLLALEVAARYRLPLATRGAGHSQSGQALAAGGIVLDMRGLGGTPTLDPERGEVEMAGGTRWREVIDAAFRAGWLPVGPTHFTDATVAGTLSVAGVGAESWRVGAQVNNVRELEVLTPDGKRVRCGPHRERELFDAVRSGLGQFGLILRTRYPLRRVRPKLRCHVLHYRDLERFAADVERACEGGRCSYLTGFVARHPASGEALYSLVLGEETDGESTPAGFLAGLQADHASAGDAGPIWTADAAPPHPFFGGYSAEDDRRASGCVHPWVEHLYDRAAGLRALHRLREAPPVELELGSNALIMVARAGIPAPLFALPPGAGRVWGVGTMPRARAEQREAWLLKMREQSRLGCADGGRRYLSGFVEMGREEHWAAHHGPTWEWMKAMKRRVDPAGLLNPGFVAWPPHPP